MAVNRWSGGTSTQLYIYPEHADYAKRDFIFRISTATVEAETSQFTSLPGTDRIIMPLEGEFTLSHKGHYTVHLKRFETDHFKGDWETSCTGKATDFNLMLRENAKGSMQGSLLSGRKEILLPEGFNFIYCFSGEIAAEPGENSFLLSEGDIAVIKNEKKEGKLVLSCPSLSKVVYGTINI